MKYSLTFKKAQVSKVLSNEGLTVSDVSRKTGVPEQTLRDWLKKAKEGTLTSRNVVTGLTRSPKEKFNLLIESRSISEENMGFWLRQNGLHSEHLTQYEQELRDMTENQDKKKNKIIKELKSQLNLAKKEINKKDKALAEMAALYTLKKKAENFWEEKEDA